MYIEREINGEMVKIYLTVAEKEEAYRDMELYYHTKDVELWWKNNHDDDEPCPFTDEDKVSIANSFSYILDDNDVYWQNYWASMEQAVDEQLEDEVYEE